MSVLIKGMSLPKDCVYCPIAHWNKLDNITGCEIVIGKKYIPIEDTDFWESSERPSWCPLEAVSACESCSKWHPRENTEYGYCNWSGRYTKADDYCSYADKILPGESIAT